MEAIFKLQDNGTRMLLVILTMTFLQRCISEVDEIHMMFGQHGLEY